ncbi:MAG: Arm DNA-binding domain-containing protein [Xanthobacteraceae bacterium]|uniref:Arm DNA-binding domain-containing protein n=1 Tax=Pseudolabrys sp. TaxID=1960880 RepID=UPI003D0CCBB8
MVLTVFQVSKAVPRDKPFKLADGHGLHLLVNPNGSKLWRFRYRFAGKEQMLSFGSFPEVSLADARAKRDEARKQLAAGINPVVQRKEERVAAEVAARNTFGAVAEDYLRKLGEEGKAASTLDKNRWLLCDLAAPLPAQHSR